MKLADAQQLIERAFDVSAAEYGADRRIACAVVGSHGELVAFAAQDGCVPLPRRLAPRKAYTALSLGRATSIVRDDVAEGRLLIDRLNDPELLAVGGGAVLRGGGEIVGAIGISGLLAVQDQLIADALANPST